MDFLCILEILIFMLVALISNVVIDTFSPCARVLDFKSFINSRGKLRDVEGWKLSESGGEQKFITLVYLKGFLVVWLTMKWCEEQFDRNRNLVGTFKI